MVVNTDHEVARSSEAPKWQHLRGAWGLNSMENNACSVTVWPARDSLPPELQDEHRLATMDCSLWEAWQQRGQ